jgi:nucleotide-binding universal stress UspA family protein
MNYPQPSERIVVGIDGSDAAINGAQWAVAEATSRDIPLRLIHAIPERRPAENPGDESLDVEYGETALRLASAALHAMGEPVKIEAELVQGPPDSALIKESDHAAIICIGSVGIGAIARKLLGSTAESVASDAHCPVAVIRGAHQSSEPPSGWVAVVVDGSPGNDAVLEHGFREARLRQASILAMGVWRWGLGEIPYQQLEHRLGSWVAQYPEVHVRPVPARRGVAEYLSQTGESVQLAVVDSEDANEVARMVGPTTPHLFGRTGCSVLVVRS